MVTAPDDAVEIARPAIAVFRDGVNSPAVPRTSLIPVPPGADYVIRVVGDRPSPLRDFYHALLRRPWWVTIATITLTFVATNALFACAYRLTGGIAHARSYLDDFFFSVQTMGTVGYGAMYPESNAANLVVLAEAITGITLTALVTGLVFAKFSRSTARLRFTSEAVICPLNGVPSLMLRVGNQRGNRIVDAQIRVVMMRTERTREGSTFYRNHDLRLQRDRALTLARSFNVIHVIDRDSPLWECTPETFVAGECELQVLIVGLDDVTMQTVHGSRQYFTHQVIWGARHRDVLSEASDGALILDLTRFDEREPTPPTPEFPYSAT
jgi:inward rectifier potassium channel